MFKCQIKIVLLLALMGLVANMLKAQQKFLKVYYPDDTLSFELDYKSVDSLEEGKLVAFYKKHPHQIAFEKNYYYGKQSGIYKAYYPSGRTMIFSVYQAGKRHGDWTYYGTDGSIREKAKYKEGSRHGFYINKVEKYQGRYKNGLKHGKWEYNLGTAAYRKEYFANGKLTSKPSMFEQVKQALSFGEKDSSQTVDGKNSNQLFQEFDTLYLPQEGQDEKQAYPIRYIHPDSINHPTMMRAVFQNKPEQIAVVKYRVEGKLNGLYKEYYPSGNIYHYVHYSYGKLDGDWKEYRPNGSLKMRGNYRDGKKHGKWLMEIGTEKRHTLKYKMGEIKK